MDVHKLREDFPILRQHINGKPLVYLDNAATSQKPKIVIERLRRFYAEQNANIHRGLYQLSEIATEAYERARVTVQQFIGAASSKEIIFTRGATEAINLVAQTFGRQRLSAGDEVLVTYLEHHSNIVPWQLLCEEKGAILRAVPINDAGELLLTDYERLLNQRTRMLAITHVSNALGTINPLKFIIELAKRQNIPVLVDGAQGVPHLPVNVSDLACDFYVFSGHKLFGPTGTGVLYGKADLLEGMPPYQGGGDMILSVSFEKTIFNHLPYKFEAGTPNIAGVIGLATAISYIEGIGLEQISAHEQELLTYATGRLGEIKGLRLIGTARDKAAVLSFTLAGIHPHDIGTVLDQEGIAIRAGHHCAQPIMQHFGIPASARASLAFYNTKEEVDALVAGLYKVITLFR
ncbi:MAG: cysteine desulfurase [Cyanobacteria bacterium NC_groundwater_1444_Ag_S-0.65um_54_12]|nr:cysteine desulfurase [Cyanobacteria bacterium NC_groundwater_1444_Ag_S-0.65um_54_12]